MTVAIVAAKVVHPARVRFRGLYDPFVPTPLATERSFGIQLQDKISGKVMTTFNARSVDDQQKFVNDLEESIQEMTEMERAKIQMNNLLNQAIDGGDDAYETLC